jgi:hypothetical protein
MSRAKELLEKYKVDEDAKEYKTQIRLLNSLLDKISILLKKIDAFDVPDKATLKDLNKIAKYIADSIKISRMIKQI